MEMMIAFALAGVFIIIGMLLRAKVGFLKKMYVPATVLAGVIGCIFINAIVGKVEIGVSQDFYATLVGHLFILSFISIGLTKTKKSKQTKDNDKGKGKGKGSFVKTMIQGSIGMGFIWCIMYALSALVGFGVLATVGKPFGIDPVYGLLIPFGFCEGPGLAVSFGMVFEDLGWENAVSVGLTFAATGFLSAFLLGVPLAKYGIKKGLGSYMGQVNESVARGYYRAEEQRESIGKVTTYSGSLETFTFHFTLMAIIYIIADWINKLLGMLPGTIGVTLGGLPFMYGLLTAYGVKFLLDKLHIGYLHNDALQSKITGFISDFLVVFAFMAVEFATVEQWIVPLLIEIVVVALLTAFVCIFLGQRLGSGYDFERTLGLVGTCCGTAPSGIALIRMIDPRLCSPTPTEMGLMTWIELGYMPFAASVLFGIAGGSMTIMTLLIFVVGTTAAMLIAMKLVGAFGKKTYSLNPSWIEKHHKDKLSGDNNRLEGVCIECMDDSI